MPNPEDQDHPADTSYLVDEERAEQIISVTSLSDQVLKQLNHQDSRIVSTFKASQLEQDAKKFWDVFYKRNGNRFFKDRHWTTREFKELIPSCNKKRRLFEVGCGAGNFLYPLLEEDSSSFFVLACDFSPRAIDLVKQHSLFDDNYVQAFVADITDESTLSVVSEESVDILTLIFVLSAINPIHYDRVVNCLYGKLKRGAVVLFRDYGLYDMTQIRFKAGHKISDNFYMRQDGTRSYFFSVELVRDLFSRNKFREIETTYVSRRTVNKKEGIDVPRVFVQARFMK